MQPHTHVVCKVCAGVDQGGALHLPQLSPREPPTISSGLSRSKKVAAATDGDDVLPPLASARGAGGASTCSPRHEAARRMRQPQQPREGRIGVVPSGRASGRAARASRDDRRACGQLGGAPRRRHGDAGRRGSGGGLPSAGSEHHDSPAASPARRSPAGAMAGELLKCGLGNPRVLAKLQANLKSMDLSTSDGLLSKLEFRRAVETLGQLLGVKASSADEADALFDELDHDQIGCVQLGDINHVLGAGVRGGAARRSGFASAEMESLMHDAATAAARAEHERLASGATAATAAAATAATSPTAAAPPPFGSFFAEKMDRKQMKELLQTTNMTRAEIYRLFNRFKALCQLSGTPGSIGKTTFKEGVSSLFFEDDAFVDRVFNLLDADGSGSVEWDEFVGAVNALETGTPHDKLHFCFRVYDRDNSDSIERCELQEMFTAMLLRTPGTEAGEEEEISVDMQELIDDFVNGIFDAFDIDRSDSLEFAEVLGVVQRKRINDVWEVFGRTLISSG